MAYETPPSSYWEPPEPDLASEMEWANVDADSLVAEWASEGEFEVWISVHPTKAGEPVFALERVAHDGDVLFGHDHVNLMFDTIGELREHLEEYFPLIP